MEAADFSFPLIIPETYKRVKFRTEVRGCNSIYILLQQPEFDLMASVVETPPLTAVLTVCNILWIVSLFCICQQSFGFLHCSSVSSLVFLLCSSLLLLTPALGQVLFKESKRWPLLCRAYTVNRQDRQRMRKSK